MGFGCKEGLKNRIIRIFNVVVIGLPILACAQSDLQPIHLQLRWLHQFQFVGYHMAKEKGFYTQEGLKVTIYPGGPGITPVNEVLEGRAHYGVGNIEVLSFRQQGEPLVALAALYQHSPSTLLVHQDSGIHTVKAACTTA